LAHVYQNLEVAAVFRVSDESAGSSEGIPASAYDRQAVFIAAVITRSNQLAPLSLEAEFDGASVPQERAAAAAALHQTCLDFCVARLDYDFKGDLFESAILGFFAAPGVDSAKETLQKAYHFTPTLSGFIKIAQMLVIQKAVSVAQAGVAKHPADPLDEMRARFRVHGTRSHFS